MWLGHGFGGEITYIYLINPSLDKSEGLLDLINNYSSLITAIFTVILAIVTFILAIETLNLRKNPILTHNRHPDLTKGREPKYYFYVNYELWKWYCSQY
jgi:hypothetical protein